MNKILSYISVILFILGTILSIGGFMLDKAEEVPFVLKIVAPEYSDGLNAFDELINRGPCISERDNGFSTLANLALSAMQGNHSNISISKICRTGSLTSFGNTVKSGASLDVTINLEQTLEGFSSLIEILERDGLLNRGQCLNEADKDFSPLANLSLSSLGENISNVKIMKICGTGSITKYNGVDVAGLLIELNREQNIEWFSYELEPLLKDIGEKSLFFASVTIFSVGIILNILSFIIERSKDKK